MDISQKLKTLLELPAENEVVEFKEANNSYDFKRLGKYFSALSNEANLKRQLVHGPYLALLIIAKSRVLIIVPTAKP
jgi:hypothetical protein